jgi:hypothetical protein
VSAWANIRVSCVSRQRDSLNSFASEWPANHRQATSTAADFQCLRNGRFTRLNPQLGISMAFSGLDRYFNTELLWATVWMMNHALLDIAARLEARGRKDIETQQARPHPLTGAKDPVDV